MKFLLVLGILCSIIAFCVSESSEESSEESDTYQHHHHAGRRQHKCEGLEDVDLSDLSLDASDLRKLILKSQDESETDRVSSDSDGMIVTLNDIKTSVVENGMGAVRKVVVLPTKRRIYAKILKMSKAQGDLSTSFSGSVNTSLESATSGNVTFGVDLSIFGPQKVPPHTSLTGEASLFSNSSTRWVKKHRVNVLETISNALSSTTISWTDDGNNDQATVSLTSNSSSTSTSNTVVLSKKCFATKVTSSFNSSASGTDWSSVIIGKGKGGVYSRVLFSTTNGTSVSWSFAKLTFKTHLEMKGSNWSVDGSQYITVKSFTETITRPINPTSNNGDLNIEISNEIKIRVGVKTTLSSGAKIYSTGGQILFRNSKVNIPALAVESHGSDDIEGDNSDEEVGGATLMIGTSVLRKQLHADEIINPGFVNSVIASTIN